MALILNSPKKSVRRVDKALRDKWINDVEILISDAERWAGEEPGWTVTRGEKEIEEGNLGKYQIPTLKIEAGRNELHLEPIARYSWRGDGQINFHAFPTLYSVRLLRDDESGKWHIRTDSGIDWPVEWGCSAFIDIGKRLIEAL